MFGITVRGRTSGLADLFAGVDERDRLGVIVREPCGALGASTLITATVTAFYDAQRRGSDDFFVYPDYYLFHVGRALGDHSMLDVWPGHKEVVVPDVPEEILRAVNDRGVTRLVVSDREAREPALDRETLSSAHARIRTCLAYSPAGRARDADVRIEGNAVSERYVDAVLDPERLLARLDASSPYAAAVAARASEVDRAVRERLHAARTGLAVNGVPIETYRRITLEEALARL